MSANVELDYKYYLTSVNWTNNYDNVMCFASKAARNNYFNLVSVFNNITEKINFNITNLYRSTLVVDSSDYISALQKNYIIICKYDENNQANNEYYFYFITNARQCNSNRIELTIELDVYQQYYYDVVFADCPINRAKVQINEKIYSKYKLLANLNGAISSEPIDYPLFYKEKKNVDTTMEGFSGLNGLVHGWLYVFVDPTHSFQCYTFEEPSTQSSVKIAGYNTCPDGQRGIFNNLGVLCFPVYSGAGRIKINVSGIGTYTLNDARDILSTLINGNAGADAAHIYSLKLSRRPPFTPDFITRYGQTLEDPAPTDYTFNCTAYDATEELYLAEYGSAMYATSIVKFSAQYGLRFLCDTNQAYNYWIYYDITSLYNPANEFDPLGKLASSQYTKTYIDFGDGNKMELDLARLYNTGYTAIQLEYKEAIVPDITRYSVCINSPSYNAGSHGIEVNNQTFTADMSMIFALDQWAEFLANNKNFYAQGNFNSMMKFNKQTVSALNQGAGRNLLGGLSTLANATADFYQFTRNREYQVDNLQSAVDRVINQNGSALFNLIIKGLMPTLVIYALPSTLQASVVNYLKRNGVSTTGLISNIKTIQNANLSDSEYHYAFIQADADDIVSGNMSLECEQRLLGIFKKGTRFWYNAAKMYDYTY